MIIGLDREVAARTLKKRYPELKASIPELMMGLDVVLSKAIPQDRFYGYTLGPGATGEPERMEVCDHGYPLGWACIHCGEVRDGYKNSRPARPAKPRRYVLRAECNHCGRRSWLDEKTGNQT